jgi:transposase
MIRFKLGEDRMQQLLFPASINEYVSDDHLAKLIYTIVSTLNLDNIIKKFSINGQRGYCPHMLLSIIFYGYSIGIKSSRKLSAACEERLDFMYLSAKLIPSYKTISEFRRGNIKEISELFQEIILIGIKLGLVDIGNIKVSIDGTKIRANASGKLSKDEEGLEKLLNDVNQKVAAMMIEAETIDKQEDFEFGNNRGDELPKELQQLETRKAKIENAIDELKKEKEGLRKDLIAQRTKSGKDEKLTKAEEKKIKDKKINITDHDAPFMKERSGCIKTNYNAQASVDEKNQFIIGCDVTTECNDKKQLIPMIDITEKNIQSEINVCKADSGYHSGENLSEVSKTGMIALIDDPYKQRLNNENFSYDKINFKYDPETDSYTCPEGGKLDLVSTNNGKKTYKTTECINCSAKSECAKKSKYRKITRNEHDHFIEQNRTELLKDNNQKEYKKRMHTVEPVFGNIKYNTGFRQFSMRGFIKAKYEFNLMCIGHNIKKIAAYCNKNKIVLSECLQ